MNSHRDALLEIVRLNSDLVGNCAEGISERDALERPLPGANNIVFLIAHLAHARYYLGQLLGSSEVNPLDEILADVKSIEEVDEFPSLQRVMGHWFEASDRLEAQLAGIDEEFLAAEAPRQFPVEDSSLAGTAGFLLQHEAYHLGQLGLLRKGLGYESMSYRRRKADRR